MNKMIQTALIIKMFILASLSLSATAVSAQGISEQSLAELKTFSGRLIKRDSSKITHLVFIDLWRSFKGNGDEKMIAALPDKFLQQSQQIWLQPEINVTKAQLADFQQYFPQIKPLVLDEKFSLMRELKIWQSPFHVLISGNEQVFSGDTQALLTFIAKEYSVDINAALSASHNEEKSNIVEENQQVGKVSDELIAAGKIANKISKTSNKVKAKKPLVGDLAPTFSAKTLTGKQVKLSTVLAKLSNRKPLNLVFIDALCPMPHFPNCEAKLVQLNELIKTDNSRQWLAVVNSYYVNEEFAQQFAEKFSLKLPLLFDHDNSIFKAYQVYASPYHIKVNRQGFIESRSDLLN